MKYENVESVCLTAHIWGVKSRSFLGVTAHWVEKIGNDEKSHVFVRKSAAIAIKRFVGMSPFLFKFITIVAAQFVNRDAQLSYNCVEA